MTNYLMAGELIAQRLREQVPEFKDVLKGGNLGQISRHAQRTPVAYVLYRGDNLSSDVNARGQACHVQSISQEWLVVIAVNLMEKNNLYTDSDQRAGELIDKTLKALMGVKLTPDAKPLYRSSRGVPVDYVDGWAYYSFIFHFDFIMRNQ
ncbi:phage tail terminator protein [Actinobacillus delphinicola]|uniref:Mu-like prophage protein gp37 n=1 Tax=Actinobacillus delphinicola TaxID=51161 RepID=A0A448TUY2_9PAST|nr:hypothetical protein [Actinobacillus delphinicola]VEJ09746.1 Uncharacterised protein [Actinobacillus delphinicola]